MQETLQQKGPTIEAEKGVRARIYYWKVSGGWGFATRDEPLPKEGRKPRTNYFIHSRRFQSRADTKVISDGGGGGEWVEFDVDPQEAVRGQAIDATRIRLIKG